MRDAGKKGVPFVEFPSSSRLRQKGFAVRGCTFSTFADYRHYFNLPKYQKLRVHLAKYLHLCLPLTTVLAYNRALNNQALVFPVVRAGIGCKVFPDAPLRYRWSFATSAAKT